MQTSKASKASKDSASGASGVASNVLISFKHEAARVRDSAAGHPSCHKGRNSDAEFDGMC